MCLRRKRGSQELQGYDVWAGCGGGVDVTVWGVDEGMVQAAARIVQVSEDINHGGSYPEIFQGFVYLCLCLCCV